MFEEASRQQKKLIPKLEVERKRLLKDRQARSEEIRRLVAIGTNGRSATIGERLAELEGVVGRIEGRVGEMDAELAGLQQNAVDPEDVSQKLAVFDGVWEVMHPAEQVTLIKALVNKVMCSPEGDFRFAFASGSVSSK